MSDDTAKITMNVLRLMAETFAKATPIGTWLTRKQMRIDEEAIRYVVQRLLTNLVKSEMLEQSWTKGSTGHGAERMYRPTEAGWNLLRGLDGWEPEALRARFASDKPRGEDGVCGTCGSRIKDRRSDARVCWGCAEPGERVKTGHDHLPRSAAYYKGMRGADALADKRRVRAARKAMRPDAEKTPRHVRPDLVASRDEAAAVRGKVLKPGSLQKRKELTEARYQRLLQLLPKHNGYFTEKYIETTLGCSASTAHTLAGRLRDEGKMLRMAPGGRKGVPKKRPADTAPVFQGDAHDAALTDLAVAVSNLRDQIAGQTRAIAMLAMDVRGIRVASHPAKATHLNGKPSGQELVARLARLLEQQD